MMTLGDSTGARYEHGNGVPVHCFYPYEPPHVEYFTLEPQLPRIQKTQSKL
jgi:hypothetical protein